MHMAILMLLDSLCTAGNALEHVVIVNISKTNIYSMAMKLTHGFIHFSCLVHVSDSSRLLQK